MHGRILIFLSLLLVLPVVSFAQTASDHAEAGDLALGRGDFIKAIAAHTSALGVNPDLAWSYGQRGYAYLNMQSLSSWMEYPYQ